MTKEERMDCQKLVLESVKAHGIQTEIARKTGIARSTVAQIFLGNRRATREQAGVLEKYFLQRRIPVTRWDLFYFIPDGMPLVWYIERRIMGAHSGMVKEN